jgi:hypothetical protein
VLRLDIRRRAVGSEEPLDEPLEISDPTITVGSTGSIDRSRRRRRGAAGAEKLQLGPKLMQRSSLLTVHSLHRLQMRQEVRAAGRKDVGRPRTTSSGGCVVAAFGKESGTATTVTVQENTRSKRRARNTRQRWERRRSLRKHARRHEVTEFSPGSRARVAGAGAGIRAGITA